MGQLVTGRGAIFAIGRHVQHRPEPRLQRQRFGQQGRAAAVMVTDRQAHLPIVLPVQHRVGREGSLPGQPMQRLADQVH